MATQATIPFRIISDSPMGSPGVVTTALDPLLKAATCAPGCSVFRRFSSTATDSETADFITFVQKQKDIETMINSKMTDTAIIIVVWDNAKLEFVFSASETAVSWSSDDEVLDTLTDDLLQKR